jgi:hypothetical protein
VNDGGARAGARAVLPYTRISVVVVAVVRTGTAARFGYLGFIDDGVGVVVIIDALETSLKKTEFVWANSQRILKKHSKKNSHQTRPTDRPTLSALATGTGATLGGRPVLWTSLLPLPPRLFTSSEVLLPCLPVGGSF